MNDIHYIGFDVHKKSIQYCVLDVMGHVIREGRIQSTRAGLEAWASQQKTPWKGALEATMFSGWIYDVLKPHAVELKMAHPAMLKAIGAAKHASDRLDARTIASLVRADLIQGVWVAPPQVREMRTHLRLRNLTVRQATQTKNRMASVLMEHGVVYVKSKLHQRKYFAELVDKLTEVPDSVRQLLRNSRQRVELFERSQQQVLRQLQQDPRLSERVARLQTVPGVGPVLALTWALEIGDPQRFANVRRAQSYCGLVSAFQQSGEKVFRQPLSKKRNPNLQTMLIEVAHLAPRYNPVLRALYEKVRSTAHANAATIAVARKLVAYLMAVDKSGQPFQLRMTGQDPAPSSPTGSQCAFPPEPPIGGGAVAQPSSPSRVRSAAQSAPWTAPGGGASQGVAMGGSDGKAKSQRVRR